MSKTKEREKQAAMSKIKKVAEINIMELKKGAYGVTVAGSQTLRMSVLLDVIGDYMREVLDFVEKNPTSTFHDFHAANQAKVGKPS